MIYGILAAGTHGYLIVIDYLMPEWYSILLAMYELMQTKETMTDFTKVGGLKNLSKRALIELVRNISHQLRKSKKAQEAQAAEILELKEALFEKEKTLQAQSEELDKIKQKEVNSKSNQPSSKQAEFNKETGQVIPRFPGVAMPTMVWLTVKRRMRRKPCCKH